jgi:NADPH:quinone reductase
LHPLTRSPVSLEGISFVDAATLPCAALTAYCALYRRLDDREGDIVLVHAAAGGVGGFAVQMAKAAKAFVIGTCSDSNAKYVRELGADEAIPKALQRLAEGHVRGKIVARVQS